MHWTLAERFVNEIAIRGTFTVSLSSIGCVAFTLELPRLEDIRLLATADWVLFRKQNHFHRDGPIWTVLVKVIWKLAYLSRDEAVAHVIELISATNALSYGNLEPCQVNFHSHYRQVGGLRAKSLKEVKMVLRSSQEAVERTEQRIREDQRVESVVSEPTGQLHPGGIGCNQTAGGHCSDCGKFSGRENA